MHVSIVIPTYNRAQVVPKAIESVLAQTYRDYEVIVVDDGSQDDTEKHLKKYEQQVCYIRQQNRGVSAARNTGILAAKGEWIAFLDSDDEWLPGKLAAQMEAVSVRPDLLAHSTNTLLVMHGREPINLFQLRGAPNLGQEVNVLERPLVYALRAFFFPSAVLVRRSVLLDIGLFDTSLTISEDLDVFSRVSLLGPWGVSRLPLTCVIRRNHVESSLSQQFVDNPVYFYSSMVRIYSRILRCPGLLPAEQSSLAVMLSGTRYELGTAYLKEGCSKVARQCFMQAIADCPSLRSCVKSAMGILFGQTGVNLLRVFTKDNRRGFRRSKMSETTRKQDARRALGHPCGPPSGVSESTL